MILWHELLNHHLVEVIIIIVPFLPLTAPPYWHDCGLRSFKSPRTIFWIVTYDLLNRASDLSNRYNNESNRHIRSFKSSQRSFKSSHTIFWIAPAIFQIVTTMFKSSHMIFQIVTYDLSNSHSDVLNAIWSFLILWVVSSLCRSHGVALTLDNSSLSQKGSKHGEHQNLLYLGEIPFM